MHKLMIRNIEEMEMLAKIIAHCSQVGMILCLEGDLGAGKTTLTQLVGKHLGIIEFITSPTFSIIKEYKGTMNLYHMDAYRILNIDQAYDLDIDQYFYSDGLFIIEWSDRIKDIIPANHVLLTIQHDFENNARNISVTGSGHHYSCIIKELSQNDNFRN
ncbi:MAG: tRNA (adenosine(37)-N6)-threonylcarbamoyltransferase complex ATPase subunit type 1 TsaE [Tissierellales bacterium]|nr:tRNA (adenosine(37)-N6)-threonylcarbamoyltransferase complex ATPase subunit type 1 TsaE [Tissierellales bacterium]MBN2828370.1 tRNA (adenosine(37)-N6)-threonylcarbamoyltransferase complex ATPase subunit type 1 TsaE [Tissierellales bacterium]